MRTNYDKRAVQDLKWYDPPEHIWELLNRSQLHSSLRLNLRNIALGSLLYMCTLRISEALGGPCTQEGEYIGELPPVNRDQFSESGNYLTVRGLKNLKHRYYERSGSKFKITKPEEYPDRIEIKLPKKGSLSRFTEAISNHLELVDPGEPVFRFSRDWGYKIINGISGEFPHYYKDMGLKLWYRILDNDPFKLKIFSGHAQWSSLERYMNEIGDRDYERALEF